MFMETEQWQICLKNKYITIKKKYEEKLQRVQLNVKDMIGGHLLPPGYQKCWNKNISVITEILSEHLIFKIISLLRKNCLFDASGSYAIQISRYSCISSYERKYIKKNHTHNLDIWIFLFLTSMPLSIYAVFTVLQLRPEYFCSIRTGLSFIDHWISLNL